MKIKTMGHNGPPRGRVGWLAGLGPGQASAGNPGTAGADRAGDP
jgi:hypothetical protein